jgi:hypothetical protein
MKNASCPELFRVPCHICGVSQSHPVDNPNATYTCRDCSPRSVRRTKDIQFDPRGCGQVLANGRRGTFADDLKLRYGDEVSRAQFREIKVRQLGPTRLPEWAQSKHHDEFLKWLRRRLKTDRRGVALGFDATRATWMLHRRFMKGQSVQEIAASWGRGFNATRSALQRSCERADSMWLVFRQLQ